MKLIAMLLLFLLAPSVAYADPIYFLGMDRGVYRDAGDGIKRVGLGTGNNLAVHNSTMYLAGDDGQLWSADAKGRWMPSPSAGKVRKVAFDGHGTMYVLGAAGGVYRYDTGLTRHGLAVVSDLGAASNGDLYAIGTDGKIWNCRALLGGQAQWTPYNALAQGKKLAVAPDGTVYLIGNDNGVYQVGPQAIQRLGLATAQEVSVSPSGQVGIVGMDNGVYLLEGRSTWRRLGGGTARQVVWPR